MKTHCPYCKEQYEVEPNFEGITVQCTKCEKEFVVKNKKTNRLSCLSLNKKYIIIGVCIISMVIILLSFSKSCYFSSHADTFKKKYLEYVKTAAKEPETVKLDWKYACVKGNRFLALCIVRIKGGTFVKGIEPGLFYIAGIDITESFAKMSRKDKKEVYKKGTSEYEFATVKAPLSFFYNNKDAEFEEVYNEHQNRRNTTDEAKLKVVRNAIKEAEKLFASFAYPYKGYNEDHYDSLQLKNLELYNNIEGILNIAKYYDLNDEFVVFDILSGVKRNKELEKISNEAEKLSGKVKSRYESIERKTKEEKSKSIEIQMRRERLAAEKKKQQQKMKERKRREKEQYEENCKKRARQIIAGMIADAMTIFKKNHKNIMPRSYAVSKFQNRISTLLSLIYFSYNDAQNTEKRISQLKKQISTDYNKIQLQEEQQKLHSCQKSMNEYLTEIFSIKISCQEGWGYICDKCRKTRFPPSYIKFNYKTSDAKDVQKYFPKGIY